MSCAEFDALNEKYRRQTEIDRAWESFESVQAVFTGNFRVRLCGQQNWRCCYCGCCMSSDPMARDRATFEHVIPRSRGGSHDESNLVMCCSRCNTLRGNYMHPVHIQVLRLFAVPAMFKDPTRMTVYRTEDERSASDKLLRDAWLAGRPAAEGLVFP